MPSLDITHQFYNCTSDSRLCKLANNQKTTEDAILVRCVVVVGIILVFIIMIIIFLAKPLMAFVNKQIRQQSQQ